ncbi:hypothetical protein D3C86_1634110 [compost metagenome]
MGCGEEYCGAPPAPRSSSRSVCIAHTRQTVFPARPPPSLGLRPTPLLFRSQTWARLNAENFLCAQASTDLTCVLVNCPLSAARSPYAPQSWASSGRKRIAFLPWENLRRPRIPAKGRVGLMALVYPQGGASIPSAAWRPLLVAGYRPKRHETSDWDHS